MGEGDFGGFRAAAVDEAVGIARLAAALALEGRRGGRRSVCGGGIEPRLRHSNVVRTGGYFPVLYSNAGLDERGEAVEQQRHVAHGEGDALAGEGEALARALGVVDAEHGLEAHGEDGEAAQGEVVGDAGIGEKV